MTDFPYDRNYRLVGINDVSLSTTGTKLTYACPEKRQAILTNFSALRSSGGTLQVRLIDTDGSTDYIVHSGGDVTDPDRSGLTIMGGQSVIWHCSATDAGTADLTLSIREQGEIGFD